MNTIGNSGNTGASGTPRPPSPQKGSPEFPGHAPKANGAGKAHVNPVDLTLQGGGMMACSPDVKVTVANIPPSPEASHFNELMAAHRGLFVENIVVPTDGRNLEELKAASIGLYRETVGTKSAVEDMSQTDFCTRMGELQKKEPELKAMYSKNGFTIAPLKTDADRETVKNKMQAAAAQMFSRYMCADVTARPLMVFSVLGNNSREGASFMMGTFEELLTLAKAAVPELDMKEVLKSCVFLNTGAAGKGTAMNDIAGAAAMFPDSSYSELFDNQGDLNLKELVKSGRELPVGVTVKCPQEGVYTLTLDSSQVKIDLKQFTSEKTLELTFKPDVNGKLSVTSPDAFKGWPVRRSGSEKNPALLVGTTEAEFNKEVELKYLPPLLERMQFDTETVTDFLGSHLLTEPNSTNTGQNMSMGAAKVKEFMGSEQRGSYRERPFPIVLQAQRYEQSARIASTGLLQFAVNEVDENGKPKTVPFCSSLINVTAEMDSRYFAHQSENQQEIDTLNAVKEFFTFYVGYLPTELPTAKNPLNVFALPVPVSQEVAELYIVTAKQLILKHDPKVDGIEFGDLDKLTMNELRRGLEAIWPKVEAKIPKGKGKVGESLDGILADTAATVVRQRFHGKISSSQIQHADVLAQIEKSKTKFATLKEMGVDTDRYAKLVRDASEKNSLLKPIRAEIENLLKSDLITDAIIKQVNRLLNPLSTEIPAEVEGPTLKEFVALFKSILTQGSDMKKMTQESLGELLANPDRQDRPKFDVRRADGKIVQISLLFTDAAQRTLFTEQAKKENFLARQPDLQFVCAGTSTIDITPKGVDKQLPVRFMDQNFGKILDAIGYQPGERFDARAKGSVYFTDFDGTLTKDSESAVSVELAEEIDRYLTAGGVMAISTGSSCESIKERLGELFRIDPAPPLQNLVVFANNGATMSTWNCSTKSFDFSDAYMESARNLPTKPTQLDCVAVGDSFQGGNDSPQAAATGLSYVNVASKALQTKGPSEGKVELFTARHLPGNQAASLALLKHINAKLVAGTEGPVFTKGGIAAAILSEKAAVAKQTGPSSPPSDLYPFPLPF